jgi:hypothetical protein
MKKQQKNWASEWSNTIDGFWLKGELRDVSKSSKQGEDEGRA